MAVPSARIARQRTKGGGHTIHEHRYNGHLVDAAEQDLERLHEAVVDGHPGGDGQVDSTVEHGSCDGLRGCCVDGERPCLRSEVTDGVRRGGQAERWHLLVEEAVVVVRRVEHHQFGVELAHERARLRDGGIDGVQDLGVRVVLADQRGVGQAHGSGAHAVLLRVGGVDDDLAEYVAVGHELEALVDFGEGHGAVDDGAHARSVIMRSNATNSLRVQPVDPRIRCCR